MTTSNRIESMRGVFYGEGFIMGRYVVHGVAITLLALSMIRTSFCLLEYGHEKSHSKYSFSADLFIVGICTTACTILIGIGTGSLAYSSSLLPYTEKRRVRTRCRGKGNGGGGGGEEREVSRLIPLLIFLFPLISALYYYYYYHAATCLFDHFIWDS